MSIPERGAIPGRGSTGGGLAALLILPLIFAARPCAGSQAADSAAAPPGASRAGADLPASSAGPPATGVLADAGRTLARLPADLAAIGASPLHLRARAALWIAPLGAAAAVMLATDSHVASGVAGDTALNDAGRAVSLAGTGVAGLGVAAAFYFTGRLAHDERARETGQLSGEALFDSWIVVAVLKTAANRARPGDSPGQGRFWNGGTSFPSGHSITAWTLAAVIAREYREVRWVPPAGYGLAALIGVARVASHSHYPSDVLAGATLGFLIGRHVVQVRHSDAGAPATRSSWIPAPRVGADAGGAGLSAGLLWRF